YHHWSKRQNGTSCHLSNKQSVWDSKPSPPLLQCLRLPEHWYIRKSMNHHSFRIRRTSEDSAPLFQSHYFSLNGSRKFRTGSPGSAAYPQLLRSYSLPVLLQPLQAQKNFSS